MTMYKVLHPRSYLDRLFELRKEGGHTSIKDSVDASILGLDDSIKKHKWNKYSCQ